jgi:predicted Rossmann fold flavoprotein
VDVLEALLRRLNRSGAKLATTEPAREVLAHPEGGFHVVTSSRMVTAEKVLITSGGRSYPGCGTTGDGYGFATAFGHTIVPQRPALAPLTVQAPWIAELRGITISDVNLKIFDSEAKLLDTRRGSMLFAHFGLTGPAPLDVSRTVSGHPEPGKLILELDLLPSESEQAFDEFVRTDSNANGRQLLAGVLSSRIPRRVADQLLVLCGMPAERKAAALSKPDRQKIVAAVKRLRLPLKGTLGFEKAEVTAGGVSLDEVDSRTMQSKKIPGLYFAGEVLDLDGWIGGYNFQSAWSTGWLAGREI